MKKFIIAVAIILLLAAAGYKFGMKYVSEAVINKVANQVLSRDEIDKLVQDPQVQKVLQERLGTNAINDLLKKQPGTCNETQTGIGTGINTGNGINTGTETITGTETVPGTVKNNVPSAGTGSQLVFNTAEDALKFLLTKFSSSELNGFIALAEGGVTSEEREQIKSALLARLTPEEYQALKVIGLIELQKRQQVVNLK